ncbi:MAG: DapH/DapD/GlmU-related protein [Verrucomicrobiota bacterium]|nr:DapH/DapD/GlmU-related protein [Verrucomicrobiota bacterium]
MKTTTERLLSGGLRTPAFARPPVRLFHLAGVGVAELLRLAYAWLIVKPVVTSIAQVGPGLGIERIPYVRGRGRIRIGAGVYISGKIGIAFSRRAAAPPELIIGDRAFIGHDCGFLLAERIEIGAHCLIATGARIQDNDGHPLDPDARRCREPVLPGDVKPVRVGDNAWIGARALILKSVTIGENAVVGAGAVVTRDVAPNTVVAGNPAVVVKSIGVSAFAGATADKSG